MGAYIKDGNFTSKFDALVSESLDRWKVPGASVAVVHGNITISKGYGFSRLPDVPVVPATLFNCGSMTKAFTATAVSLLVDNEEFSHVQWETPVSHLIRDDFVLSDSRYTEQVTVEDILSHRSGLPDHDNACFGVDAEVPDTPKSVTRKLRDLPLSQPLRAKFQYSNLMYTAAAHLVESLTGQWLGDFLSKRIWAPIGMSSTYYGMGDVSKSQVIENLARSYGWDEEKNNYYDIPWCNQPEGSGSGEMISNVLDFSKFLQCMLQKNGPISENGHKELIKPRIWTGEEMRPFMSYQLYGLGWQIDTYHGDTIINHDGCVDGFASNMVYLPRLNWGVVMFGNTTDAYRAQSKICWALIDDLLEIPEERRYDWDEHWKNEIKEDESEMTVESLYPTLPLVPIPLSLPLQSYTGKYKHPGYGVISIDLKDGSLSIDWTDRTWRSILTLEHVSGEFFIAKVYEVDARSKFKVKAQFRLGPDGSVETFGIDLVSDMDGKMFWFRRC